MKDNTIADDINALRRQTERIRGAIAQRLMALPDNPKIKRIGAGAFTIMSSDMGMKWSPFYHDFKAQYTFLQEIILKADILNVPNLLQKICDKGTYFEKGGSYYFHPQVIAYLTELLMVTEGGEQ